MNLETHSRRHAYALLRLLTGLDFFMHGFSRIVLGSHLSGFAQGMVKSMATTPLSTWLTLVTGYAVPCVELLIGLLLVLGVFTRQALITAFLLMFVLMFGVTLKQDWTVAGQQLVYGLVLFLLLFLRDDYEVSWRQHYLDATKR